MTQKLSELKYKTMTLSRDFKRVPFILRLKPDESLEKIDENEYHSTIKYKAVVYHDEDVAKMVEDGEQIVVFDQSLSKNGNYHFYNYDDEDKLEAAIFDYAEDQEEARFNAVHGKGSTR